MGAFQNCNSLVNIEIPSSITSISDDLFLGCRNLNKIIIPSTVTSIGSMPFDDCSEDLVIWGCAGSYAEIYANEKNIKFKAMNATWDISKNEDGSVTAVLSYDGFNGTLTISGTGAMKDWDSISDIPWYAEKDNLKKVIINEDVENIGAYAFYLCSDLVDITIPNSVTNINEFAFFGCSSLTNVEIPASVISI